MRECCAVWRSRKCACSERTCIVRGGLAVADSSADGGGWCSRRCGVPDGAGGAAAEAAAAAGRADTAVAPNFISIALTTWPPLLPAGRGGPQRRRVR